MSPARAREHRQECCAWSRGEGLLKFLIADDHGLIREGLRYALEGAYRNLQVIEASDGRQVLERTAANPDIDLILLDYFMPGTDGFGLVSTLCDRYPHIPVVILSAATDPLLVHKTLERGVAGFIPKVTAQESIIKAVDLVLSGGIFIPPDIEDAADQAGGQNPWEHPVNHQSMSAGAKAVLAKLTRRQQQVLRLIVKGKTNKDISRDLNVSENTIKVHVTAILKILRVSNRTQALLVAQKLGLARK
jgi:DNA-binding NarL/FixJ family response regulator